MKTVHELPLRELKTLKISDEVGAEVLSGGLTIAQTNEGSALITENIYRNAFERGIAMFYRDERSPGPHEFVRANPDGSEDLVFFNASDRSDIVIKQLQPVGQGQFAWLGK